MQKIGFDNDAYIQWQSMQISRRIQEFGGKLYLEFGGKLFDDYHAARVLPGFLPDSKLHMLKHIAEDVEIVIVINATDIENNKIRRDLGISYDDDVLRLTDAFRETGLYVGSVVIAQFQGQPAAESFRARLRQLGIRVFLHYPITGYPYDLQRIVSEQGLGQNEYIETTRPLVVVTAPGPGSGKLATCLSQLYHDHSRGIRAGYAKFETFPVWNLPLKDPLNLAYEAATADLQDVNMIDPYHLEAYGETTVNYNRDVEAFPVMNAIFERIGGKSPYRSPTDMGVNMVGSCIIDRDTVNGASRDEILRRYFAALCDQKNGSGTEEAVEKIERLMTLAGVSVDDRGVVAAAVERARHTGAPAVAIELPEGGIVTGKTSDLLGASAAALLNAVKAISGQEKAVKFIDRSVIEPIQELKTEILGNRNPRLHSDEVLIALTMSAVSSPAAKRAVQSLSQLKGCEAHATVILPQVDQETYRKLGLNLTCEPQYQTRNLYHK